MPRMTSGTAAGEARPGANCEDTLVGLVEKIDDSRRADVERRAADRLQLGPLLETDLPGAGAPRGGGDTRRRPPHGAEGVGAEADDDGLPERPAPHRRERTRRPEGSVVAPLVRLRRTA